MAKISVSLPDELKERLDDYAENNGFKRSAAVAHILESFFAAVEQAPISADSRLDEIDEDLDEVQTYITQLHEQDPDHYPKPPWVEKTVRMSRSFIGR